MKRNNLFMLTYIIFIFAACCSKPFWEYSMWNKFVAAVTVTSFFLTISDLLYTLVRNIEETVTVELKYVDEVGPEFNLMKKELKKYLEKGLAKNKEYIIENTMILEQNFKSMRQSSKNIRAQIKRGKIIASGFTILGFLSFFLIIVFEPIASYIISVLDSVTVSAFGFVLLTQYLSEEKRNDLFKDIKKCIEHKNAIIELRKSYQQEVLRNAD